MYLPYINSVSHLGITVDFNVSSKHLKAFFKIYDPLNKKT